MPSRGQILYIRPITPADFSDLQKLKADFQTPAEGLLGRLVGETVCFAVVTNLASGDIRIDDFYVVPELRRKRVGRVLMRELEEVAAKLECPALVVSKGCDAPGFFRKMGFSEVESMLRKTL